ncbi:MAG: hypothetical protein KDD22_06995, partial [Bdellovibrionales bacterium]|nr:hypothetical protein [Bdellovibrionales bacterium]
MKLLKIESSRFELARVDLVKPDLTIGSGPNCDINCAIPQLDGSVLQLKWQGPEVFNPQQGVWFLGVDS